MIDNRDFKQYIRHFRVRFLLLGIVFVVFVWMLATENKAESYDSPNTERVYGEQRVFDYANQLTGEQEASLEAYIHEAEKKTCLDLVIVTLNQSLRDYEPEYMANYSIRITPDKYVMVYADKFWEDNRFGYNSPQKLDGKTETGDGIILVDNLYREEETGKIYTWMGTTGKAEEEYSSAMIDEALDIFYEKVEYDYYHACMDFIDAIVAEMGPVTHHFRIWPLILAAVIACIYWACYIKEKPGRKTVTEKTYLVEGSQEFQVNEDMFVRKHVTKTYVPPSSGSSGGGGHHSSGGGGSHGGGGHSR